MATLLLTVLITFSVTMVTILSDYISSKLLSQATTISKIQKINVEVNDLENLKNAILEAKVGYLKSELSRSVWGAELTIVTLSLDFVAVGIYVTNSNFFPFFTRFNSNESNLEILVILSIIIIHILFFLVSQYSKNAHFEFINNSSVEEVPRVLSIKNLHLNKWKLLTNTLGFLTLLSAVVVFINAI